VREIAVGVHQKFDRVVDAGGIGLAGLGDGFQRLHLVAEGLVFQPGLPCPHPVDVATDRVDLAVVDDSAVRVGEMPRAERVRREPGVDERERRLQPLVGEVGVVRRELFALEQPLVDERLPVKRADVEPARVVDLLGCGLGRTAGQQECLVELVVVHCLTWRDERLPDIGFGVQCGLAEFAVVGRHVPPVKDIEIVVGKRCLEQLDQLRTNVVVLRHEDRPDGVRVGQVADDSLEKFVGSLNHDAGAVARCLLGPGGATVFEITEQIDSVLNDAVGVAPIEIYDGPNAAV